MGNDGVDIWPGSGRRSPSEIGSEDETQSRITSRLACKANQRYKLVAGWDAGVSRLPARPPTHSLRHKSNCSQTINYEATPASYWDVRTEAGPVCPWHVFIRCLHHAEAFSCFYRQTFGTTHWDKQARRDLTKSTYHPDSFFCRPGVS